MSKRIVSVKSRGCIRPRDHNDLQNDCTLLKENSSLSINCAAFRVTIRFADFVVGFDEHKGSVAMFAERTLGKRWSKYAPFIQGTKVVHGAWNEGNDAVP